MLSEAVVKEISEEADEKVGPRTPPEAEMTALPSLVPDLVHFALLATKVDSANVAEDPGLVLARATSFLDRRCPVEAMPAFLCCSLHYCVCRCDTQMYHWRAGRVQNCLGVRVYDQSEEAFCSGIQPAFAMHR